MLTLIKIYIKASIVFAVTLGIAFGLFIASISIFQYFKKSSALRSIPVGEVRPLKFVTSPHYNYEPTIQTWQVPPLNKLLSPLSWLIYSENCFLSCRMNAMKFVGMIPGHWTIKDFKQKINSQSLLKKWALNTNKPLTDKTINEINKLINKNSNARYSWYSLENMDELIHVLRKGHHVMIYNKVWIKPTKKSPKMRLYIGNYAHVSTLTGIKSYDPEKKIIEFDVYDPLPFFGVRYPVFSKLTKDGWNMFGRQSVPFIVNWGDRIRTGYIIREK